MAETPAHGQHDDPADARTRDRMDAEAVRRVARLCLLEIPEDRCAAIGEQLTGVLGHVEALRGLDLDGVEPMAHVGDRDAPLADDTPGDTLDPRVLDTLTAHLHTEPGAPDADGVPGPDTRYLRVPKVIEAPEDGRTKGRDA